MKFLEHFEGIFSNKYALARDLFKLFKLEAKLAGLNLHPLLIDFSLLIAFAITLWFTVMLLAGDLVYIVTKNPLIAILVILFVNLIAFLILARDLKHRLQQMSFARTRDCIRIHQERSECEPEEERAADVDR
ncbi:hypothetical protein BN59_02627 [Legionella massiliensis]|uniref:Uncharacterized protein n=1 Tax=Legionella massiliensis TaxID=1034943 RepID=A0A078KZ37_9GAMM|nr:hypothetical protein [Legionella massiliensis]CDZ78317.1 hypothetical protein BN59_02627 [Legionella massiliensis]CEE14055.1 hypothetical protein BN1094_02627 [Legionella massiliensis]